MSTAMLCILNTQHGKGEAMQEALRVMIVIPHTNFVAKYLFKANDGLRHATYFTMRWEPQGNSDQRSRKESSSG